MELACLSTINYALPHLRSRQTYLEQIRPRRVEHLRARIREHRPNAVIFYSRNYQPWWEQIAGAAFEAAVPPGLQMIKTSDTLFVMTMHPTSWGVTTAYFVKAGTVIADTQGRALQLICEVAPPFCYPTLGCPHPLKGSSSCLRGQGKFRVEQDVV